MLGSKKKCSNCHGTKFRRIKVNRTIQCENCKVILEERCMSDLMEYHAVTQTEEVYCVVTPDFLHTHLVDDIPNDPYCTPGFISAFRMLSPLREPVYAASSRTLSGALAEMERLIGDALFAGYVGYNGRAPGAGAVKKEESADSSERNKSGGDARHTLVAYFEIVELASILCVDKETANLAIRIFRHTANNTSLRNRNVESLATAAFVSAAERRWHDYQGWLKHRNKRGTEEIPENGTETTEADQKGAPQWPVPPRRLTVEEISTAANLDTSEVLRYLKVVNIALRKQRTENDSSVTGHMPTFCRRLELPQRTQNLAIGIAENAIANNICSRRNPVSVSAAAIYLACQLDGVRKTQTEICRATSLTEVTLRKVYKELNREHAALLPDWYKKESNEAIAPSPDETANQVENRDDGQEKQATDAINGTASHETAEQKASERHESGNDEITPVSLVPPPLPPGFGEGTHPAAVPPSTPAPGVPCQGTPGATSIANPLMAMMNNPALQAFANAFSMMPQFMMPPPPPPLPPSLKKSDTTKTEEAAQAKKQLDPKAPGDPAPRNVDEALPMESKVDDPPSGSATVATAHTAEQQSTNVMAGMQSMMGMMQAMHAFQTMQQQSAAKGGNGETANPWAMMAAMMAQAQTGSGVQMTGATNGGSAGSNMLPPAAMPSAQGEPHMPSMPAIPSIPAIPSMPAMPSIPAAPPVPSAAPASGSKEEKPPSGKEEGKPEKSMSKLPNTDGG